LPMPHRICNQSATKQESILVREHMHTAVDFYPIMRPTYYSFMCYTVYCGAVYQYIDCSDMSWHALYVLYVYCGAVHEYIDSSDVLACYRLTSRLLHQRQPDVPRHSHGNTHTHTHTYTYTCICVGSSPNDNLPQR
jgi:hypothetical protein